MRKIIQLATLISISLFSSNAFSVSVSENFDDGFAQNWTLDGLWHVTDNAPFGGTGYALGYVKDETSGVIPNGNFDTGSRNFSTALSPSASCPAACSLSFDYIKLTESGSVFDILKISITQNSSEYLIDTITSENISSYTSLSFDLTSLPGLDTMSSFNVEFYFDSIDSIGNDGAGVRVDNFSVGTPTSVVPVPAAVWLFGSGLLGLIGLARRKKF